MNITRRTILGAATTLPLAACAATRSGVLGEREASLGGSLPLLTTSLDRPLDLISALKGKRVAILTHAAGVDRMGQRSIDVLSRLPGVTLTAIWSPEHGLAGTAAAGDHVDDGRDGATGLPIHSLYGKSRTPTPAMLDAVDVIFIDLQDVGVRAYTYISTVAEVLKVAGPARKPVLLNDRPNPLGGIVMEGPVLDPKLASFVGVHPVPLRHGMTMGELATMINDEAGYNADLKVLPIDGWRRPMGPYVFYTEPFGAFPFVPPSPNLRSVDAIIAYAGTVLLEGTTISEGRGTDAPFLTLGAPFMDRARLASAIKTFSLRGALVEIVEFVPNSGRYKGLKCSGIFMETLDPGNYRSVESALSLLSIFIKLYPEKAGFLPPSSPGSRPFFDYLMGDASVRPALMSGINVAEIVASWQAGLTAFAARRTPYLLYS